MASAVSYIPSPAQQQVEITLTLPDTIVNELQELATKHGRAVDELFLDAFGLLKIASDAALNQQKLYVADRAGKPVKEIVVFR